MPFAASAQLIRDYREYVARCKAKQTDPMDCQAFYLATLDGQQLIEYPTEEYHEPKNRLDSLTVPGLWSAP